MTEGERREPDQLTQPQLDDLAASLDIRYSVLDNLTDGHATYQAEFTISNNGDTELGYGNWTIYFSHIRMIEPGRLPCDDGITVAKGLHLMHINGCLFRLRPTPKLAPLKGGQGLTVPFLGQHYSVARSDMLPNWFLTAPGLQPKIIASTSGEDLDFVAPFDSAKKWKRFDYTLSSNKKRRFDFYDPFTPEVRFERNVVKDAVIGKGGTGVDAVIPTPVSMVVSEGAEPVTFEGREWTVMFDPHFRQEAEYLAEKLQANAAAWAAPSSTPPPPYTILLSKGEAVVRNTGGKTPMAQEGYHLSVSTAGKQVGIRAGCGPGMLWGVQTLLSLTSAGSLTSMEVDDAPRYGYRGMHVDVSRNFHGKESVLRLLDVMSTYKMNKFHFHLTDDEGWRLQIPGLPELTEVGGRRCHSDLGQDFALLPLLGSGPLTSSSGSGFFTVEDYREILRFATRRHIEVIPEIDMPGHCHAAVKSMQARYNKLKAAGDIRAAEQYLLSDLSATINAESQSVQMFNENSLNPGLPSTFEFIRKVVTELKAMHSDICPLRVFHFGGDEVPYEAWEDSPACQALIDSGLVGSFKDLMEYFVVKVAGISAELGLEVGAWQDGIVHKGDPPYPRHKFPQDRDVLVHAWKTVWETGRAGDVYKLANCGYKVVLSPGTHLYFDHPQEPDPEERGLYWACRYADTRKVFCFAPDNLFSNADVRLTGKAFSAQEVKAMEEGEDFAPLEKPENILGIQGQLWTELVRTSEQFDSMIYPRLLALAERAWHQGAWESGCRDDPQRREECDRDWGSFARRLGNREMERLDRMGVQYYLPPPGARLRDGTFLEMNCQVVGLPLQFSTDAEENWTTFRGPVDVGKATDLIVLRTCSADSKRYSRVIKMSGPGSRLATGKEDS